MFGEMKVRRVETAHGSHIEPPLDLEWSDLAQLRWLAAVVMFDTGGILRIRIQDATGWSRRKDSGTDVWVTDEGVYSMNVGWSSLSPQTFDHLWTYLNGISIGAEGIRRHYEALRLLEEDDEDSPVFNHLVKLL